MLSRCQRLSIASKYNRSLSISLPQGAHFIDEKDSSDDGYANLSKSSTRQGPAEAANYSWDAVFDGLPDAVPIRATLPTRMSRASLGPKFFSRNELPGSRRKYSTQAPGSSRAVSTSSTSTSRTSNLDNLFGSNSNKSSSWASLFTDIDSIPPPSLSQVPRRDDKKGGSGRRVNMTASEMTAFEDMFNTIFGAAMKHMDGDASVEHSRIGAEVGIGSRSGDLDGLFGKLRKHSRKQRLTSDLEEQLDRRKEAMDLCETDQQLLEWAMREVFAESKRYEQEAKNAMTAARDGKEASSSEPLDLQPPTYPHLIASLMQTFRDKYNDPHLALSIFDHARHLSIPSYVFGCTTPAYNELLRTRWLCFRDIRGVHDALEEMVVNGVEPNAITRQLVETIRAEAGPRNMWSEEHHLEGRNTLSLLDKIGKLVERPEYRRARAAAPSMKKRLNGWRNDLADDKPAAEGGEGLGYSFGFDKVRPKWAEETLAPGRSTHSDEDMLLPRY